MRSTTLLSLALAVTVFVPAAFGAQSVRFTDLTPSELESFLGGKSDQTVEFHAGDRIPITMEASGDLLQTVGNGEVLVEVQQRFLLKMEGEDLLLSYDGETFVPFKEAIHGRAYATARGDDDGRVTGLTVGFEAWRDQK